MSSFLELLRSFGIKTDVADKILTEMNKSNLVVIRRPYEENNKTSQTDRK